MAEGPATGSRAPSLPSSTPLRDDATPLCEPYERVIEHWAQEIDQFGDMFQSEQFVWRGLSNAIWGLWSSPCRRLAQQLGRVPTEEDLVV